MEKRKKELSVRALLEQTVNHLEAEYKYKKVGFENPVRVEIADDSDWHRTKTGYMTYEKLNLFSFNGNAKYWAIGLGTTNGGYPAADYDSDIIALLFNPKSKRIIQIRKELTDILHHSTYFSNSLICGEYDGNLSAVKKCSLGQKVVEKLKPEIEKFIAKEPKYDSEYIRMDNLAPMNTQNMMYKPKFVEFLSQTIIDVLKEI